MISLDTLLSNPKYYSSIIRSTGLLNEEDRNRRIHHLITKDVWLAARCKNTCVREEEAIVDDILIKCSDLYEKEHDLKALVAILELGEVGVFCYLLNLEESRIYYLYDDSNQTVPHLFSVLGRQIKGNLFWEIFGQIVRLGYPLDTDIYNLAISHLESGQSISSLLNTMQVAGVTANIETYAQVLLKTKDINDALGYYHQFRTAVCEKDSELHANVTVKMLKMARTSEERASFYKDYHGSFPSATISPILETEYYSGMLAQSCSFDECFELLRQFRLRLDNRTPKKKYAVNLMTSVLNHLQELPFEPEAFMKMLKEFSLLYQMTGMNMTPGKSYFTDPIYRLFFFAAQKSDYDFLLSAQAYLRQRRMTIINPAVAWEMIKKTENRKEMTQFLGLLKVEEGWLSPRMVVDSLRFFNYENARYLVDYLKEHSYQINVYIYNVLIKKATWLEGMGILKEMEEGDIFPDIQSIQPLMLKANNKQELLRVIAAAASKGVDPDERLTFSLVSWGKRDSERSRLVKSIDEADLRAFHHNSKWVSFIKTVQTSL